MTSSKNASTLVDPAVRFASDFSNLMANVDRLMIDMGHAGATNGRNNGHKNHNNGNGKLQRQARAFFATSFEVSPLLDLCASLTAAQSVDGIGDAIRKYCTTVFGSPAGIIFLENRNQ